MRDLTEEELEVLNLLRDATVAFAGLPQAHPADMMEFTVSIHDLQNIVLARPATETVYDGEGKEVNA